MNCSRSLVCLPKKTMANFDIQIDVNVNVDANDDRSASNILRTFNLREGGGGGGTTMRFLLEIIKQPMEGTGTKYQHGEILYQYQPLRDRNMQGTTPHRYIMDNTRDDMCARR